MTHTAHVDNKFWTSAYNYHSMKAVCYILMSATINIPYSPLNQSSLVDNREQKVGRLQDSGAAQHQILAKELKIFQQETCLALRCHIIGVDLAQSHNDCFKDATVGWWLGRAPAAAQETPAWMKDTPTSCESTEMYSDWYLSNCILK